MFDAFFNGQYLCLLDDSEIVKLTLKHLRKWLLAVPNRCGDNPATDHLCRNMITCKNRSQQMTQCQASSLVSGVCTALSMLMAYLPYRAVYLKYSPITDKVYSPKESVNFGTTTVNAVTFDGISLYFGTNESPARIIQLGIVNV